MEYVDFNVSLKPDLYIQSHGCIYAIFPKELKLLVSSDHKLSMNYCFKLSLARRKINNSVITLVVF